MCLTQSSHNCALQPEVGDALTVFQALDPDASAAVTGSEDVQSVRIVHHLDQTEKAVRSGQFSLHRLVKLFSACSVCRTSGVLWLISGGLYLKRVLVGAGDHVSPVLHDLCTSDAVQLNGTSPELFLWMQTMCQQQQCTFCHYSRLK